MAFFRRRRIFAHLLPTLPRGGGGEGEHFSEFIPATAVARHKENTMPQKQPTTTTVSKEKKPPPMRVIKTSKCRSLSGGSTLTHQFGHNKAEELFIRITANSGGGLFNKDWVAFEDIRNQFEACPEQITSHALAPLLRTKSANNAAFLMAVLLSENVIQPSKEKPRHFVLQKLEPFLGAVAALCKEKASTNSKSTPRRKQQPPKEKASEE